MILSVNTRNLNVRAFLFTARERTEKSCLRLRDYLCVLNEKLVTLLPFSTPLPLLIPLVLCPELSDKKANREFRSVRPRMYDSRATAAGHSRSGEIQQRPHGDICIPSIAFEEMFIASSSVKRISSRQRAIFLSTCAKSRPAFFVISESG